MDYVFRWLASRFLDADDQAAIGIIRRDVEPVTGAVPAAEAAPEASPTNGNGNGNGHNELKVIAGKSDLLGFVNTADAPICADCGSSTVRSGACYKCMNCGSTTGCS
jgi:ribonucleoside-diphosphate reductase alpha chain